MTSFIISVLAFLLTIFPSCGILLAPYQSMTFPGEKVITEEIMSAIKTKDVAALEAMMSNTLKKGTKDLSGEINKLIDIIDGEITEFNWFASGGSDESNWGKQISRTSWKIEFKTATESYRLDISWVIVNNREPNEIGIKALSLCNPDLLNSDQFWIFLIPAEQ